MMALTKHIAAAAIFAFLALPGIQASPCKPSSLTTLLTTTTETSSWSISQTSSPSSTTSAATTTDETTTFTTESSTSVLTVSTSAATTTSISEPPFECRPANVRGCSIDNFATFCCSQCCFFPEGDVYNGKCC
ncbi:hypothetical protein NCS56_01323200 [Fusarium sp. Ph1]|nr:hypothetical protein NCS56_01323200 [Fusarium sp. Ph1]